MCRFMLRPGGNHGWFHRVTEPFFVAMTRGYERTLGAFLRFRWLSAPIFAASLALIFWVGGTLPSELAPLEDLRMRQLRSEVAQ